MLERDFSRKHVAIGLGGLVAAVALPFGLSAWFAAVVPPAPNPVAAATAAA